MPGGYGFLSRGDGVRSCLTPDSRPPSRIDFLRENRLRLAALQERNLEQKKKDEERRSTQRTPKTKHASSTCVSRPRSAFSAGTTDVLILSSPSNTAPTHTNDSDLSNAETPEKFSPTSRNLKSSSACSSSIVYALSLYSRLYLHAKRVHMYVCVCVCRYVRTHTHTHTHTYTHTHTLSCAQCPISSPVSVYLQ
jgi:hypothetical protein